MTGVLAIITVTLVFGYAHADILFGKDYYETLRKHITHAEESIVVAMYFIIMEDESPVNTLVDELIVAKSRGVKVEVLLEDAKLGESLPAYNKLKESGIEVRTDLPGKRLHIKGVVIDERYVFLGSANWTRAAIEDNYEGTAFIDSESDAKALLDFIEKAKAEDSTPVTYEGASIPADFLLNPKKGRVLFTKHSNKQLDLYLLLLREYARTGKTTFEVDEKAYVEEMGYKVPKDFGSYKSEQTFYHDTIRNLMKRLKKAGFIEDYKTRTVALKTDTESPHITIPYEYWEYGYDDVLSMRAKYMYLICLYEAPRSVTYPYWFHSQEDMSKLYGISTWAISKGLLELEKVGALEVTRSKPRPPDFSSRKANVYKLLSLKPIS